MKTHRYLLLMLLVVTGCGAGSYTPASTPVSPSATPTPSNSLFPSDAVSVSSIQTLNTWKGSYDSGTPGSSTGTTALVDSPAHDGSARQFVTKYQSSGGERYWVSFGNDATSKNFLYDAWVYLTSTSSHISNLELDMNQTMANGQTVIYGVQCDGYSGTWDYTENTATAAHPSGKWVHSAAACNVRKWTTDTWHHVQISYSRDETGNVTYKAVYLDSVEQDINATVFSAHALGWGPTLLTNFQIDGLGSSGSATVYVDDLTVYRW